LSKICGYIILLTVGIACFNISKPLLLQGLMIGYMISQKKAARLISF
jgi:hypothetical protein